MSTPAKPQNVCKGCRSRKKKCDGSRPSCSSCVQRGEMCFYERDSNPRDSHAKLQFGLANDAALNGMSQQGWDSWPVDEMNGFLGLEPQQAISSLASASNLGEPYEWMTSGDGSSFRLEFDGTASWAQGLPTPQDSISPPPPTLLPPLSTVLELVDLYFERFYQYLPVIHQPTLISNLRYNGVEGTSQVLLFAIMAVAAGAHPDHQIRQSQLAWFDEAKARVSKDMHSPDHALQTLQAAVLIVYQSIALTDYSASMIVLGEAWRKAVAIGCTQPNGLKHLTMAALGSRPSETWVDSEESRRVAWMLFILDRGMCFPIGLAHAIDDRRLRINFPIAEEDFQNTIEPDGGHELRYTQDFDGLVTAVQEQSRQGSATLFQYLVLAYALLGHISETIESLDFDDDQEKQKLDTLTAHLVRIRLMLPRSATELSAANQHDYSNVLWLNAIMSVCTILLHHRPLHEGESLNDAGSELATNWPHCVAAARSTVAAIRDASRASLDFISNAHLASLVFTSCRILAIEYFCPSTPRRRSPTPLNSPGASTRDPKLRDDLEIVAMIFSRMRESLNGVGKKFARGMCYNMRYGEDLAPKSKAGGARDLLRTCNSWTTVGDDFEIIVPP